MRTVNLQETLSQQPLGLVFDIDGTLSPYVLAPLTAQLHPEVLPLLARARKYAHVVFLTSRDVDSAATMVDVDELFYMGTYGLEWCEGSPRVRPVQILPEAAAYIEFGRQLLDFAEQELSIVPGINVIRRRVGGAIEYSLAPDPEQARQMILSVLEEPARRVTMRLDLDEAERIVEVRAPLEKGDALRRFVRQFGLHGVVFAGDDLPDLGAFLEVSKLRQAGVLGLSVVVQHANTLPILLESADVVVQEVEGMVKLLREMVTLLYESRQHL